MYCLAIITAGSRTWPVSAAAETGTARPRRWPRAAAVGNRRWALRQLGHGPTRQGCGDVHGVGLYPNHILTLLLCSGARLQRVRANEEVGARAQRSAPRLGAGHDLRVQVPLQLRGGPGHATALRGNGTS